MSIASSGPIDFNEAAGTLKIHRGKYLQKMAKDFGITEHSKQANVPMDYGKRLQPATDNDTWLEASFPNIHTVCCLVESTLNRTSTVITSRSAISPGISAH